MARDAPSKTRRARSPDAGTATDVAAFFDLDKTLIPGSGLFALARGLHARGKLHFSAWDIVRFGWGHAAYLVRGEVGKDIGRSRRSGLELVAGRSQEELRSWAAEIAADRIVPRVYEEMAAIIEEHRARGEATILVTAAPLELGEAIADQLGLTGALGTVAEVDPQGLYTGQLPGPVLHGPDKAKAVNGRARQLGLSLSDCSAYSDSINDLPLLELVGHPHAVNPDRKLKHHATSQGWPIHELRGIRRWMVPGAAAGALSLALAGAGLYAWLRSARPSSPR